MMEQTFKVPCPHFDLELSCWDRRMAPMYSKRIFCFSLPNSTKEQNNHISHLLFAALKATVEDIPFLAGSVVPVSADLPWLRNIVPHGVACLKVRHHDQEIDYKTLHRAQIPPEMLDDDLLCPFPDPVSASKEATEVCRLQANFVGGGLLFVASISHIACDGRGITKILETFTSKLRQVDKEQSIGSFKKSNHIHRRLYSFNRASVLSGNSSLGFIKDHPAWTTVSQKPHFPLTGTRVSSKLFRISKASLLGLKNNAIASVPPSHYSTMMETQDRTEAAINISTHDAIAALIWGTVMSARHRAGVLQEDSIIHFSQAVDCRTRLTLPEPYFGNAFYGIKCSASVSQLLPKAAEPGADHIPGLSTLAYAIRKGVNEVTADKFRDLLAFVERTENDMLTRLAVTDDVLASSLLLVSYFWFEMHELDWGETLGGRIEAFRLPRRGLIPGVPVILPRLLNGDCEFVISDREEVLGFLEDNEVFRKFAVGIC